MSLDFPAWIRVTHFLNILFLSLLARSGIEILGAHPKLYWNNHCRPGSEWLSFTDKRLPDDEQWTSHDEEEAFSPLVALPGRRHLGLGRHWHFASVLGWVLTGLVYVVLLFGTGEWRRLVPTSWSVIPDAWDALVAYLQFRLPEAAAYNGLQQLSYAGVVFLLSPFLIATGAAMSPAIGARFPWYPRLFGGMQRARSLHFLGLVAVAAFTLVHTLMVVVHGMPEGLSRVLVGEGATAIAVGVVALAVIVALHVIGTAASLRSPRAVQRALGALVDPLQHMLSRTMSSRQHHGPADITSFFRINGRPPESAEYAAMARDGFAEWRLRVGGKVEQPLCLSLDDLRAMPRESNVTTHHCIQGWSNIGRWTGVPVGHVLDRCRPFPTARYAVFRALDDKGVTAPDIGGKGFYYEVVDLALLRQPQAILAYEMNGEPLETVHGAPLRLRLENQLGFKMVKYLTEIELVDRYDDIGEGMGGWREDAQQYSREAAI